MVLVKVWLLETTTPSRTFIVRNLTWQKPYHHIMTPLGNKELFDFGRQLTFCYMRGCRALGKDVMQQQLNGTFALIRYLQKAVENSQSIVIKIIDEAV